MLLRIGLTNIATGNLLFRMLDVVSFRRPDTEGAFFGFDRFRHFQGETLVQLSARDEYVNEQVVAIYTATCAASQNCLLDCTSQRVQMHIDHNMQQHFDTVLRLLMARPGGGAVSMPHGMVGQQSQKSRLERLQASRLPKAG